MIVLLRKRPCRSPGDDVVITYWTGNYATKVAPVLNKLQVAAWGIRERRRYGQADRGSVRWTMQSSRALLLNFDVNSKVNLSICLPLISGYLHRASQEQRRWGDQLICLVLIYDNLGGIGNLRDGRMPDELKPLYPESQAILVMNEPRHTYISSLAIIRKFL